MMFRTFASLGPCVSVFSGHVSDVFVQNWHCEWNGRRKNKTVGLYARFSRTRRHIFCMRLKDNILVVIKHFLFGFAFLWASFFLVVKSHCCCGCVDSRRISSSLSLSLSRLSLFFWLHFTANDVSPFLPDRVIRTFAIWVRASSMPANSYSFAGFGAFAQFYLFCIFSLLFFWHLNFSGFFASPSFPC